MFILVAHTPIIVAFCARPEPAGCSEHWMDWAILVNMLPKIIRCTLVLTDERVAHLLPSFFGVMLTEMRLALLYFVFFSTMKIHFCHTITLSILPPNLWIVRVAFAFPTLLRVLATAALAFPIVRSVP